MITLLLSLCLSAAAQVPAPPSEPSTAPPVQTTPAAVPSAPPVSTPPPTETPSADVNLAMSAQNRATKPYGVSGHFSLLETWVPMKYGAGIQWNPSASSTVELEYSRGRFGFGYWKIDLADVVEERWSLAWRYFGARNSFNILMGVNHDRLATRLGNKYLSTIPGIDRSQYEALEIRTIGVELGLSNRFQLKNGFAWGIDWLVVRMPVALVEERAYFLESSGAAEYRDDVEKWLKMFRHIPMVTLAKIQLGYSF